MDIKNDILTPIDKALDANSASPTAQNDELARIEGEVYELLLEGVGYEYDIEEAERRFEVWRSAYTRSAKLGAEAVERAEQ